MGVEAAIRWMNFQDVTKINRRLGLAISLILLVMLVGCNGSRRGVLSQLPDPALRSGVPGSYSEPAPKPLDVTPTPVPSPSRFSDITVVLDPGHGGKDSGTPGCASAKYPEKTINLALAFEVQRNLENRGIRVIMTRTDDRFITLDERPEISNRANADLFVSIHVDASTSHSRTGTTVYISRSPCQASRDAAESIANGFRANGYECLGIRQSNFRVLAKNDRACVLVECGFLTNAAEARNLCDPSYQARLASVLADSIARAVGQ